MELRPPDYKLRLLQEKMEEYMANGVQLGWLIDPMLLTVTVYRPDREPEVLKNPTAVAADGPIDGFVLDLANIFD